MRSYLAIAAMAVPLIPYGQNISLRLPGHTRHFSTVTTYPRMSLTHGGEAFCARIYEFARDKAFGF
jgi:hypothetical protein